MKQKKTLWLLIGITGLVLITMVAGYATSRAADPATKDAISEITTNSAATCGHVQGSEDCRKAHELGLCEDGSCCDKGCGKNCEDCEGCVGCPKGISCKPDGNCGKRCQR